MNYKNVDSWVFKLVIFGAAATMALGNVAIAPVLPTIEEYFSEVSHIDFLSKMLITLPSLVMVIFAPIMGFMMDKFGRLKIVLAGMLVWSLSGSAGFFINDIYWLLFSRVILGIGTSTLTVGIPVLISTYYAGERKDKALGFMGFSQTMGGAIFIVISGQLGKFGWHYSFLAYFIEIFVFILAFLVLFEPQNQTKVTENINGTNKINFNKFLFSYFIGFFVFGIFFIAPIQTPYLLTEFFHIDSQQIGLMVGLIIAISGFSPLAYAWLKIRLSVFRIFFVAYLIMGCGLILMGISSNIWMVIIGGMMSGASFSIVMINNISYLFSLASSFEKGRAYGILGAVMSLGMFVSPLFSQTVVKGFGLKEAYVIYGVVAALFGLLFIFKKSKNKQ